MQRNGSQTLSASGLLILVGFLAGSAIGIASGEPSLGAILGVMAAAILAVLLWWLKR